MNKGLAFIFFFGCFLHVSLAADTPITKCDTYESGSYILTGDIVVDQAPCIIFQNIDDGVVFDGKGFVLKYDGTLVNPYYTVFSQQSVGSIVVQNLVIDGTGTTQLEAINLIDIPSISLFNNTVINSFFGYFNDHSTTNYTIAANNSFINVSRAFITEGGGTLLLQNNTFANIAEKGIEVGAWQNATIMDNLFTNIKSPLGVGIECDGPNTITIKNNLFNFGKTAVGSSSSGVIMTGNTINSFETGAYISDNSIITNNTFANTSLIAVQFVGGGNLSVINNKFADSNGTASVININANNPNASILVENNEITNTLPGVINYAYATIYIFGATAVVRNNQIRQVVGYFAIYVATNQNNNSFVEISGNKIEDVDVLGQQGVIQVSASGNFDFPNVSVTGNSILNVRKSACNYFDVKIVSILCENIQYSNNVISDVAFTIPDCDTNDLIGVSVAHTGTLMIQNSEVSNITTTNGDDIQGFNTRIYDTIYTANTTYTNVLVSGFSTNGSTVVGVSVVNQYTFLSNVTVQNLQAGNTTNPNTNFGLATGIQTSAGTTIIVNSKVSGVISTSVVQGSSPIQCQNNQAIGIYNKQKGNLILCGNTVTGVASGTGCPMAGKANLTLSIGDPLQNCTLDAANYCNNNSFPGCGAKCKLIENTYCTLPSLTTTTTSNPATTSPTSSATSKTSSTSSTTQSTSTGASTSPSTSSPSTSSPSTSSPSSASPTSTSATGDNNSSGSTLQVTYICAFVLAAILVF